MTVTPQCGKALGDVKSSAFAYAKQMIKERRDFKEDAWEMLDEEEFTAALPYRRGRAWPACQGPPYVLIGYVRPVTFKKQIASSDVPSISQRLPSDPAVTFQRISSDALETCQRASSCCSVAIWPEAIAAHAPPLLGCASRRFAGSLQGSLPGCSFAESLPGPLSTYRGSLSTYRGSPCTLR